MIDYNEYQDAKGNWRANWYYEGKLKIYVKITPNCNGGNLVHLDLYCDELDLVLHKRLKTPTYTQGKEVGDSLIDLALDEVKDKIYERKKVIKDILEEVNGNDGEM